MNIDASELKRAAEACDVTKCADEAEWNRRIGEFLSECDPDVTLAILAEIEWLKAENDSLKAAAMGIRDAWREDQSELAALRKDAERYRFIKELPRSTPEHLLDAAMAAVCATDRRDNQNLTHQASNHSVK